MSELEKEEREFIKPEDSRVCRGGERDCSPPQRRLTASGLTLDPRSLRAPSSQRGLRASCKPQRLPRQTRRCHPRRPGEGMVHCNFLPPQPAAFLQFSVGTGPPALLILPSAATLFSPPTFPSLFCKRSYDVIGEEGVRSPQHLKASLDCILQHFIFFISPNFPCNPLKSHPPQTLQTLSCPSSPQAKPSQKTPLLHS